MLYLTTGLPGAGKTLYTISKVPGEFNDKDGKPRPVYYSGIKNLKLPWIALDVPETPCGPMCKGACQWPRVPDGSVVVLDEAQGCMRVRAPGSKVPDHVQAMETHRHRGIDIWLITQHPNLLDTNVRRLVGRHTLVRRTSGMGTAKLFTWDRCGDPDSNTDLVEAEATRWLYDKQVFASYQSAEVHTHKVRLPKRVLFAACLLAVLVGLVWYMASWAKKKTEPSPGVGVSGAISQSAATSNGKKLAPATYQEWADERKPVAPEDVASSARYFPLTQAVRAPRVAGCVQSNNRCQCFTQQATIVQTSALVCAEIMANLRFQDWGPGGESGWQNEDQNRMQEPERKEVPGAPAAGGRTGGRVVQTSAPVVPPSKP